MAVNKKNSGTSYSNNRPVSRAKTYGNAAPSIYDGSYGTYRTDEAAPFKATRGRQVGSVSGQGKAHTNVRPGTVRPIHETSLAQANINSGSHHSVSFGSGHHTGKISTGSSKTSTAGKKKSGKF